MQQETTHELGELFSQGNVSTLLGELLNILQKHKNETGNKVALLRCSKETSVHINNYIATLSILSSSIVEMEKIAILSELEIETNESIAFGKIIAASNIETIEIEKHVGQYIDVEIKNIGDMEKLIESSIDLVYNYGKGVLKGCSVKLGSDKYTINIASLFTDIKSLTVDTSLEEDSLVFNTFISPFVSTFKYYYERNTLEPFTLYNKVCNLFGFSEDILGFHGKIGLSDSLLTQVISNPSYWIQRTLVDKNPEYEALYLNNVQSGYKFPPIQFNLKDDTFNGHSMDAGCVFARKAGNLYKVYSHTPDVILAKEMNDAVYIPLPGLRELAKIYNSSKTFNHSEFIGSIQGIERYVKGLSPFSVFTNPRNSVYSVQFRSSLYQYSILGYNDIFSLMYKRIAHSTDNMSTLYTGSINNKASWAELLQIFVANEIIPDHDKHRFNF